MTYETIHSPTKKQRDVLLHVSAGNVQRTLATHSTSCAGEEIDPLTVKILFQCGWIELGERRLGQKVVPVKITANGTKALY